MARWPWLTCQWTCPELALALGQALREYSLWCVLLIVPLKECAHTGSVQLSWFVLFIINTLAVNQSSMTTGTPRLPLPQR